MQEKSVGIYDICENNVCPRKLQMARSWKNSRERISNCFPHLEVAAFEYVTEHDTGLLESEHTQQRNHLLYGCPVCLARRI